MTQRDDPSRPMKAVPDAARARRRLNPVLLALAAILVVVGIIIWNSGPPKTPVTPKSTDLERVLDLSDKAFKADKAGNDQSHELIAAARDMMVAYVRSTPSDVEVRPRLARAYRILGDNAAAERTVDEVLRLSPQLPETLWLKGELVRARVRTKAGEAEVMKRFRNAAESPIAAANPAVGGDIWVKYGLELVDAGQGDEAQKYLKKAQDAGLDDARLAKGFGVLAFGRKQYPAASQQLALALKDKELSSDARLWRMLATSLKEQGQADAATAALQDGLTRCRDKGGLYMQLGELEASATHPDKAAAAYASATNYRDVRQEAALQAAINYYALGQYSRALGFIDMAESLGTSETISQWKDKIEIAHGFGYQLTTQPGR